MTTRAYMSIGDVLSLLRQEFPDVTISKIRFLESQGLVNPERSASGYRKFYDRDVGRLRWVLIQQREHFLPLKVIRDRLDREGDAVLDEVPAASLPAAAPRSAESSGAPVAALGGAIVPGRSGAVTGTLVKEPGEGMPGFGEETGAAGGGPEGVAQEGVAQEGVAQEGVVQEGVATVRTLVPAGARPRLAPPASTEPVTSPGGPTAEAGGGAHEADWGVRSASERREWDNSPLTSSGVFQAGPTEERRDTGWGRASDARRPRSRAGEAVGQAETIAAPGSGRRQSHPGAEVVMTDGPPAAGAAHGGANPRATSGPVPTDRAEGGATGDATGGPPGSPRGARGERTAPGRAGSEVTPRDVRPARQPRGQQATGTTGRGRSGGPGESLDPAAAGPTGASLTAEELCSASGSSLETIQALERFGLLAPIVVAGIPCYDEEALTIANLAADFAGFGVEPRHLRVFRNAVDREVGLMEQIVTPLLRQRNPEARQRASEATRDLARLGEGMRSALLSQEARRHFGL
jgi:DNA-binding transcriptional MerR regulator